MNGFFARAIASTSGFSPSPNPSRIISSTLCAGGTSAPVIPVGSAAAIPSAVAPVTTLSLPFGVAHRFRLGVIPRHERLPAEIVPALLVLLDQHDVHLVPLVQNVGDLVDPLHVHVGNMYQPFLPREELHEGSEIHQARHPPVIGLSDLRDLRDLVDDVEGLLAPLRGDRRDDDGSIVLDVDLCAGILHDLADHFSAGTDDAPDHVDGYLYRGEPWRVLGEVRARFRERLRHDFENMETPLPRLGQGLLYDFERDALDLDVHLERRDPVAGPGHLEVHIAQMVLVA